MKKVLFVCLGNICRSPLAEGLFNHHLAANGLVAMAVADSAGTGRWHVGEPPHRESIRAAASLGADIGAQRCRQLSQADMSVFDLVLGMDRSNLSNIRQMLQRYPAGRAQAALFLEYAGMGQADVPDPWGGTSDDYDRVAGTINQAVPRIAHRLLG